jgi:quercetin dioxygenase-like cupin family protein
MIRAVDDTGDGAGKPTQVERTAPSESRARPVYSPSPRPVFDRPTHITHATVTRHVWGDDEAHQVADWIYASTDRIHAMVFGLAPGGRFLHSPEFRTVFGADEVFTVLRGTMILANPQTGDVRRVETGASVSFGPNTWHHAFAHGTEELRVLELFAPPPSTGTSGPYARTRPYLDQARYSDDSVVGNWPDASGRGARESTLRLIDPSQIHYRLAGDALIGLLSSTEQLTVADLSLSPGGVSSPQCRGGDEVIFGLSGVLHVRSWFEEQTYVYEIRSGEACFLPKGSVHEYRNYSGSTSTAVLGVAPRFLAENEL